MMALISMALISMAMMTQTKMTMMTKPDEGTSNHARAVLYVVMMMEVVTTSRWETIGQNLFPFSVVVVAAAAAALETLGLSPLQLPQNLHPRLRKNAGKIVSPNQEVVTLVVPPNRFAMRLLSPTHHAAKLLVFPKHVIAPPFPVSPKHPSRRTENYFPGFPAPTG